jgi:DNA repair protein RAD57
LKLPIGQIRTLADLFANNPSEISKKCRLSPSDINTIIDLWCKQITIVPRTLEEVLKAGADQGFTTGDEIIDRVLGGGIRTGSVWEFVGERFAWLI